MVQRMGNDARSALMNTVFRSTYVGVQYVGMQPALSLAQHTRTPPPVHLAPPFSHTLASLRLHMPPSTLGDITSGHLMALLTNDCQRFRDVMFSILQVLVGPFTLIVCVTLNIIIVGTSTALPHTLTD
jgi:hypothetical protein